MGTELNRIAERASSLASASHSGLGVLTLNSVIEQGRELWGRSGGVAEKAAALPAAANLRPPTSAESPLEGLLRREREGGLEALISESLAESRAAVEATHRQSKLSDWAAYRSRLTNDHGKPELSKTKVWSGVSSSESGRAPSSSALSDVELEFARLIAHHVDKLVAGGSVPSLAKTFHGMASRLPKEKGQPELWEMVSAVAGIPSQSPSFRGGSAWASALVAASLGYVQRLFETHMSAVIRGSRTEAKLGGVPSPTALVAAFIKVHLGRGYSGQEDPVWASVFYLLRMGDAASAAELLSASRADADFAPLFAEYASQGSLSPDSANKVRLLFRKLVGASRDKFKKAVYSLVGGWEWGAELEEVVESLEDWLWLRLLPLKAKPEDLPQLQHLISVQYGEAHFSAGDTPLLYFSALWLSGQLEMAIEFLLRQGRLLGAHGVHVALAVEQANLLLQPDSPAQPLLRPRPIDGVDAKKAATTAPAQELNLARAVLAYTAAFESSDPREAINYLYLLRDINEPKGGGSLFVRCVSALVLKTGELELVLGRRETDGRKRPGLIDRLGGGGPLLEDIGAECEERGRLEVAVRLFDLADKHSRVLRLLNGLLAGVATQAPTPGSNRQRIGDLATEIGSRYRSVGCSAGAAEVATFHLLLDLLGFFSLQASGRSREALDVLWRLELVPPSPTDVDAFLKAFPMVPDELRGLLGPLLKAAMAALADQYKTLTTGAGNTPFAMRGLNHEAVGQVRLQGAALLDYAGRVPFRLHGDVLAQLVQAELRLH